MFENILEWEMCSRRCSLEVWIHCFLFYIATKIIHNMRTNIFVHNVPEIGCFVALKLDKRKTALKKNSSPKKFTKTPDKFFMYFSLNYLSNRKYLKSVHPFKCFDTTDLEIMIRILKKSLTLQILASYMQFDRTGFPRLT